MGVEEWDEEYVCNDHQKENCKECSLILISKEIIKQTQNDTSNKKNDEQ